jgi:hypothetical protein
MCVTGQCQPDQPRAQLPAGACMQTQSVAPKWMCVSLTAAHASPPSSLCTCTRRFARTAIKIGQLRLILPNGEERHYGGDDASCAPPMAAGEGLGLAWLLWRLWLFNS